MSERSRAVGRAAGDIFGLNTPLSAAATHAAVGRRFVLRGLVVRFAHRTRLARFFAICLIAFAASPVTAPFTTCDLTDFAQSHPADTPGHHPGRQLAEAHVRTSPHLVTLTFQLAPRIAPHVDEAASSARPVDRASRDRRDRHTVLRL